MNAGKQGKNIVKPGMVNLGRLRDEKIQLLMEAKQRLQYLEGEMASAQSIYRALIHMAMPPGATEFNTDDMCFWGPDPDEDVDGLGETPAPATDGDDS